MEFYAEITKKQLRALKDTENTLPCRPMSGVSVRRKSGTRACWIEFDKFMKNDVIETLERNGIVWQDNE